MKIDAIWTQFDRLFAEMDRMFSRTFPSRNVTIVEADGHIEINGRIMSLKINGKLVRFIDRKAAKEAAGEKGSAQ